MKQFQPVAATPTECKDRTAGRLLAQNILGSGYRDPAQVGSLGRQIRPLSAGPGAGP
ncbi:hypothetical protein GGQ58_004481 [Paracoccus denitrificans]|nr:hypothetical protein [Paracoccus denitrificans]